MPKRDETPIQFKIPLSGSGDKKIGPWIPEPINQPHWVYKYKMESSSSPSDFIPPVLFGTTVLFLITAFVLSQTPYQSYGFIAILAAGITFVLFGISVVEAVFGRRGIAHQNKQKNIGRKRKKFPKRRKDYR